MDLKKKLKKGTFSGVIPMMGMFIMAAVMAFQSIPISQAIGGQLSESFTDLSRVAETKSYGDLYFFNFVPNGAEHSVNNVSYSLGRDGGNVSWDYRTFDVENDIEEDVSSRVSTIIEDKLEPMTESYFNDRYGGVSQGSGCTIPSINYTTIPLPDSESDYLQGVEDNPENIPLVVRSQVETDGSSYFYSGGEAAPMEVECIHSQGATKYIGDTQSGSGTTTTSGTGTSTTTGTPSLGLGGIGGVVPGVGILPGNWVSLGYTNSVEASANRFHVLANRTAYIYKRVHDNWANNVQSVSNTETDVCNPKDSDWESLEQQTVSDVGSTVNSEFNNVVDGEVDIDGVSGDFELWPFSLDFEYDEYTRNFNGNASYSTSDIHGCDCHDDHDEDSDGSHCHETEKDLHVTVTPNASVMQSNITDDKFRVNTQEGWKNMEFNVEAYGHNYLRDDE